MESTKAKKKDRIAIIIYGGIIMAWSERDYEIESHNTVIGREASAPDPILLEIDKLFRSDNNEPVELAVVRREQWTRMKTFVGQLLIDAESGGVTTSPPNIAINQQSPEEYMRQAEDIVTGKGTECPRISPHEWRGVPCARCINAHLTGGVFCGNEDLLRIAEGYIAEHKDGKVR